MVTQNRRCFKVLSRFELVHT